MSTPFLLLVESNTTGTGRQFAQRARALGVEPVLLCADPERYPYAAQDGLRTVVLDTGDARALAAAVDRLVAEAPVAGVLSSSEYWVAAAAEIAARLHLPGPSADAVRACRAKTVQRRVLRDADVPVPRFAVASDGAEAAAAAHRLGGPVVVKPVHGSGSVGVRLCRDAGEAAEHARTLLTAEPGPGGSDVVLVEEYLTGAEFSVEIIGDRVVATVAKHLGAPPFFVETGHDVPAALPAPDAAALADSALRAVAALGLGWGAAHVELRLDGGVARVVEVNPRLAGGLIPELVRRAHGIDLVDTVVRLALGRPVDLTGPVGERGAASIRFLTSDADAVLGDPGSAVSAALAVPGVLDAAVTRPAGSRVGPAEDFRGRWGHVIATGPAAAQDGRDALLSVVVVGEPMPV